MVPGKWPARIVRTISGPGTIVGPGDIHIDENGSAWRQLSEYEAGYLRSGTATIAAAIGTIRDGKIY
jgi:hypothetical protein